MNTTRLAYQLEKSNLKLPGWVKKRDSSIQEFDINRVEHAVKACFQSLPSHPLISAEEIARAVGFSLSVKFLDKTPTVEEIQNFVELALLNQGEVAAACSYMAYRDSRNVARAERPRLQTPKQAYTVDYPEAVKFAETQMEVYWLPTEINVEKDMQDLRVNLTEAELHGVTTTLKLFTLYECLVGNEYWGGRVKKEFPRPDIEFMASTFSFVELGIHARFYNKINEVLMLNTDEFYESYIQDEILAARIGFVQDMADDEDLPLALGTFSLMEGAVLYSSFAFLKHFQAQGKNLLKNVCTGINFSVRDENIHSMAGAWLYSTLVKESNLSEKQLTALEENLVVAAKKIYEHECRIVDMVFSKGEIEGITAEQLKAFVQSRIDLCLGQLNIKPLFEVINNPVAEWFYKNITSYGLVDFFYGISTEYNRKGTEATAFEW